MSTAVVPTPAASPSPLPPTSPVGSLLIPSLIGSAVVLASIAIIGYVLPHYWQEAVTPQLAPKLGSFVDVAARLLVQTLVAVGLMVVGPKLAGENPPLGLRGGIFIVISWLTATFFIARAAGLILGDSLVSQVVTGAVLAASLYGLFRYFHGKSGHEQATKIEEQGWLSTFNYKKSQGLRLRRLTLLGLLILGWSGVWTFNVTQPLGVGDWILSMPFGLASFPLFKDLEFTLPLVLAGAILWISWRAVNVPSFADFLIATEAEMNKVAWTSRKRLVQDTIVVFITLFLMTLFLFIMDLFWGALLSWKPIGVLPAQKESREVIDPLQGRKLDW